ncbi:MAG TPA: hypothetical protein VFV80_11895, partial [Geminicoccaceae bacterium]|nr:hypothetical protein [Geminicoccaceae bacterium]
APGAPTSAAEREVRANMIANVERPADLIALVQRQLDAQPAPTTPEGRAAVARLRERLNALRVLLERHSQAVGPWAPD